ncbi:MipA family protein [Sphingomonas oleivorans]|uniref:MipA family protein n=1 Tax=Sphingomonas oleivorans TaxID=1735121 RepID=A0A2T5G235_9SPHN|nr:MipA/OmpV family protein [Sphingomonas oleivorans]PTQ13205.1 MipA family protein [Sphingomonas oleivorans]
MPKVLPILASLAAAVLAIPAAAQSPAPEDNGSPHGFVALGAGVTPEYDGAEDLRVIPFGMADVRWGGVDFEFRGLRGRADLMPDSRFAAGPVISARLSRDDADGAVGLLPEIDTAIEAGGFVGYRFGGNAYGEGAVQLELTMLHDISGTHDGLLATAQASYAAVRRSDFFLSLDGQLSWANKDYARTYFGVTAADAAASGLPEYRPGSGLRDLGAGVTAGYWFDRSIGVIGRLGASYLVGDIADSPVVDEGRRWQPTAGLGISYRF